MDLVLARHTPFTVLSSASRAAFQTFVWGLLQRDATAASLLWDAVYQVVHQPWPELPVIDVPSMGPMRTVVCTVEGCQRCLQGRGGYVFPFMGCSYDACCTSRGSLSSVQCTWSEDGQAPF